MKRPLLLSVSVLIVAALAASFVFRQSRKSPSGPAQAYADPASCAQCHATEAASYARTGMARAFYQPRVDNKVERYQEATDFFHALSGTHYSMTEHDGHSFQRRWQLGYQNKPENVEELRIDYIMGSGNHARTYLHRRQDGTLIELPLAWYAENGGHWGVNPGYDTSHPLVNRPIAYECMFCHNSYPTGILPSTESRATTTDHVYGPQLPEGIDCQRCHGPGQAHVQAAHTPGTSPQTLKATIINPNSLPPERQMQLCEQCHLESTSRQLPDRIRHFDRPPFSYQAGQPLEKFMTYFERDPASGQTDNFEIVNAPYRLKKSRCFLESKGALTCETCHDPHNIPHGNAAVAYYAGICLQCHAPGKPAQIAAKSHPASNECISCHMPKRRTEDVVHAIMTDHLIQRRAPPAQALLAERKEIEDIPANAYHGEVKLYPVGASREESSQENEDELYAATAQVMQSSNLQAGIPRLASAIERQHPARPEFSIELGDALRRTGDLAGAVERYRQALALDPASLRAQRALAVALNEAGRPNEALAVLQPALQAAPSDAELWYQLAVIQLNQGRRNEAIAGFRKTVDLKPDFADAWNALGASLAMSHDADGGETAFRKALTAAPYSAAIHANLARLLAARADWKQASFHFAESVRLDPSVSSVHLEYAVILANLQNAREAQLQAEAAIQAAPDSAQPHIIMGELLAKSGQIERARSEFQLALVRDPNSSQGHLDLGLALLQHGDRASAIDNLQQAAHSNSPATAERASGLLKQLGATP